MKYSEYVQHDALGLARLVAEGQVDAADLLQLARERLANVNPQLNAVVHRMDTIADARAKESVDGAFAGVPFLIKDLFQDYAGVPSGYGNAALKRAGFAPQEHAEITRRFMASGVNIFAKTNTPEFGAGAHTVNKVYGATGNPFDPKRTCGGSSGGSGVALALNMAPLATGSDSGGSLRIPAAYCGVVAHRSTPGVVPTEKHGIGFTTYGVQGAMARTIADTRLMQSVMARYDASDPLSTPWTEGRFGAAEPVDLSTLRVAVSEDLGFAHVDDGLRSVFRDTVSSLQSVFKECVDVAPDLGDVRRCNWVLRAVHFLSRHRDHYEKRCDELGQNVINNYEAGLKLDAAEITWALREQTNIFRSMNHFFQEFDLLICPTVAIPPFPIAQLYCDQINDVKFDNYVEWMALTWGLTIPGNPITALPCGFDATGMPFGLQVCGPYYQDEFVLDAAGALEDVFAQDPSHARPVSDLAGAAS